MITMGKWKQQAKKIKRDVYALYFAYRDQRVPWYAKVFIACVVAYAFSPIDLVPDFIPVLGYLDDLVLIPLGVALALKMIPAPVMEESRDKAERLLKEKPKNWVAGAIILLIWVSLLALILAWVTKFEILLDLPGGYTTAYFFL
ncbi:MAG: YkvA family protein [Firmicutes bacterium]|nr:YkvA family protein [Bacillota bacterium]